MAYVIAEPCIGVKETDYVDGTTLRRKLVPVPSVD